MENSTAFWMDELEKCKNSPSYFYNNYTSQGKQRPITDNEIELLCRAAVFPLKLRCLNLNFYDLPDIKNKVKF